MVDLAVRVMVVSKMPGDVPGMLDGFAADLTQNAAAHWDRLLGNDGLEVLDGLDDGQ